MTALPKSLQDNPRLDQWLAFPTRRVRLAVGKIDLGQGIGTALAQIAAEELDVDLARLDLIAGDTAAAPDEGNTASSLSIEMSGASVRLVCAEARALFLRAAALRLNCAAADLAVADGEVLREGRPTGQDYWTLAPQVALNQEATGSVPPKPPAAHRVVGRDAPRRDLPGRLFGGGFIHDMLPPGVLHARVLRRPSAGARLASLDEAAIARSGGTLVRHGDFAAILAEDETAAAAASRAARPRWEGVAQLTPDQAEAAWLQTQPAPETVFGPAPGAAAGRRYAATYTKPYQAHAPIGPSCALAEFRAGQLAVWSHTRGVYPLRATLAEVTGLPPAAITVRYAPGAGGFGAVGAEDAAADAALLAIAHPGRPVRVLWTREDEAANDPLAPAMAIRIEATLDEAGIPRAWATEIWSAPHVRRNGLLARLAMPDPPPPPPGIEPPPEMAGGATRNAVPLYAIPAPQIRLHLVEAPVRTGAFRSLGAFANIFAIESFLDELAEAAGADPLAFRLALLPDPRGRRLLERVAAMADWPGRGGSGTGGGLGLGLGRYKNRSAYAAVAARVSVDQAVRLERIWCAVDCGLVVNPDGVRNQIEGAIVQAASMALKEQVRMEGPGIASLTWEDYPILRFSEVPEIEVVLCGNPEDPALGVGEAAMGPTAAAIGNAVAHALGARLRDLPLTRERIAAALLA